MGLLSFFKRIAPSPAGAAAASEPIDAVQRARARARQRLIGAAVLVVIGIIGFPLVFETQPRPIPVDIPIEVPRKEGAPPLVMPPARAPLESASAPALSAAPNDVITESREEAGREVAGASAAPPAAAPKPVVKPNAPTPVAVANEPAPKPEPKAESKPESKPEPKPEAAGRFVVQVGAFADAKAAHETRVKVEKLGLKTYTQVAATAAGNRIRVRLGPFGSRDEAQKAQAKAKGAGLSAVVLAL